ncbi:arginine deiminase-related protein [Paracrocinitomix mangrovi]|uniref:citrulline utilization hydrolase CtlX n=1 Tax=Paracrocinitomix mangrovi TaxID=2862509 RepID=UPI001C8D2A48|nr:arginine deiminase-related protein [Paracrocinitomix mangrovi]UKN01540.1 arginine deiminase-related protein [Paracrocinitomix mangrovi]
MSNSIQSNIPNLLLMVRPKSFGFNSETAHTNLFQHQFDIENTAELAKKEFDLMVEKLKENNIGVVVFEDLEEGLPDSVFPNNWISHFPDGTLAIYPMLTPNRRAEVRKDIIDWCKLNLPHQKLIDLSSSWQNDKFLEGTGSIVFDHASRKAYACISPRTDLELLSSLCTEIGYSSISFESVDVNGKQIYHTNVMMSIAEKFALVCLESVENSIEKMMLSKSIEQSGKELIDLTYSQLNHFAGNAFEVLSNDGKSFYLMSDTAFNSLNTDQLSVISEYSTVLHFNIDTIEKIGGGSVRCMVAGMFS